MLCIYYTLCYPLLIYCVSICRSTWPSFWNKISVAQNKIIRCIMFMKKNESVRHVYPQLNNLEFCLIRKYFVLLLIFKHIHIFPGNKLFSLIANTQNTKILKVKMLIWFVHSSVQLFITKVYYERGCNYGIPFHSTWRKCWVWTIYYNSKLKIKKLLVFLSILLIAILNIFMKHILYCQQHVINGLPMLCLVPYALNHGIHCLYWS